LCAVPRFSGVELVDVPGVGRLEAYHDGMLPWLRDDPVLGGVASLDQKTLRWPGYAGTIRLLTDLGLLGEDPVATADGMVRPRAVLDAVLAPHVTPRAGETEVTVLAVVAGGERCTSVVAGTADGTSGMGRLTGGVLAAAARLLADGSVGAGVVHAHEALHGERAEALLDRLRGDAVSVVDHRGGWLSRVSDDVGEDPDE